MHAFSCSLSVMSECECLCCLEGDLGGDGNSIGSDRSGLGSIRIVGLLVSTEARCTMVMPSWPSGSEGSALVGAGPGLGGLRIAALLCWPGIPWARMYSALCALRMTPDEESEGMSRDPLADCIEERVDWLSRGRGGGKPSETEWTDWREGTRGGRDNRADLDGNCAESVTTSMAIGPICLLDVRPRFLLELRGCTALRSSTLELALPGEVTGSRPR